MTAVRQDAWSPDDDLILAEVTLRHIREGSTQLSAFEEVGERIGRTSAACGFRWNSCVRKRYEDAIQIAKQQRQKRNYMKKQSLCSRPILVSIDRHDRHRRAHIQKRALDRRNALRLMRLFGFLRQWKGTYQELSRQIKTLERDIR